MQKRTFDGVLICSDFDGTLAHHQTISPPNIDAIRYFQYETHERIHSSPLGAEIYSFVAEVVGKVPEIDYVDFQYDGSNTTFRMGSILTALVLAVGVQNLYTMLNQEPVGIADKTSNINVMLTRPDYWEKIAGNPVIDVIY